MEYNPIIGLEVHVELKTKSKMFCRCSSDYFGQKPNTHTCPVCLGLPGALPVPNSQAIKWCVMIGMALNCQIPLFSKFDRKHYFYPDLPKGYQISQYEEPFCVNGFIHLAGVASQHLRGDRLILLCRRSHDSSEVDTDKTIRIRRVHMEEDTAKLMHQFGTQNSKLKTQNENGYSLIDFNRSGVPLVEIVTEPDFTSAFEVKEYLQKLQKIVRYLGVSDAEMEKGQMRLEPNISLKTVILASDEEARPESRKDAGQASMTTDLPAYKVEVKNINSFRFVEKAINYEIERQKKILESGQTPAQETRGWDEKKQITVSQRTKEEAMDYRYFPEPDIPPIRWTQDQISNLKSQTPEMPDEKKERFKKDFKLSDYDAKILTRNKQTADYFEEAIRVNKKLQKKNEEFTNEKSIANWLIHKKIDLEQTLPAQLINKILSSLQTHQINEKELEKVVKKVLSQNPKIQEDYHKQGVKVISFIIGQVKRTMKSTLDAKYLKKTIEKVLQSQ